MKKDKRGMFICFIGIDGSGKTTQAISLAEWMNRYDVESKYVWNRFEPQISLPFLRMARRLFLGKKKRHAESRRQELYKNPILSAAYRYLVSFDYFLQIILKTRIPLMLGKAVVCDRYVYDTVVDLAITLNYSEEKTRKLLRKYLYLAPKPDLVFLLDVPEETAYQRKSDVPSIDYLAKRRKIYQQIGQENEMIILDGTKSITDLQELIQEKLGCIKR